MKTYLDVPAFIRRQKESKLKRFIKKGLLTETEMRRIVRDDFWLGIMKHQKFFKVRGHFGRTILS